MHGYIIEGKRRHSVVFWLAVLSILAGVGLTYVVDLIIGELEKIDGTQIIILL